MANSKRKQIKGYSKETLQKYVANMKKWIAYYLTLLALSTLKVSISEGNSKIGKTWNVSTAAGLNCGNCTECIKFCYDIKACIQYLNVMKARARNTAILQYDRDEYFRQIESIMTENRKHKNFRWHVSGEIPDIDYLQRMVDIARRHPNWIYWTYTKRYDIVNAWIAENGGNKNALPENLSIMFSEWQGMAMYNPYGLPTFHTIMENEKPLENVWTCPGNCEKCLAAKRGCPHKESTQNALH